MTRSIRYLLGGLAGAFCAVATGSPIVDITWSADGRFQHQSQVAAGKFAEVCGKLAEGASIRWKFETSSPTDFNIHYHVGKDVVYPQKRAQTRAAEGVLAVSVPQDYCWMWTNKGPQPVSLKLELLR